MRDTTNQKLLTDGFAYMSNWQLSPDIIACLLRQNKIKIKTIRTWLLSVATNTLNLLYIMHVPKYLY